MERRKRESLFVCIFVDRVEQQMIDKCLLEKRNAELVRTAVQGFEEARKAHLVAEGVYAVFLPVAERVDVGS